MTTQIRCKLGACQAHPYAVGLCRRHYNESYRKQNSATIEANRKRYRDQNREKISTQRKAEYQRNKASYQEASKQWRGENKDYVREQLKKWYRHNPERARAYYLKKTYWPMATWQEALANYEALHKKYNGVCAICKQPETALDPKTRKLKDLCVDHDHTTGEVRGLLCDKHNRGLGHFGDSHELLLSAITYLKGHAA